uniref:equilibrative nucleoside transporter 1-like isoform X1 n=1 Tax=Oncorhynchus gorbuscha TaxID=8017 RepID=UPI001EAF3305|nr:equilibrative nucleoside transporter 1-like isoform X1 [Oncorhynchus gorbuscha]
MSYAILPKLEFYRYYSKRQRGNRLSDEVNRLDENAAATTPVLKQGEEEQTVSMLTIFKKRCTSSPSAVSCSLTVSDWAGRSLTAVCMWPGKDSKLVPIFMVARVIFVPLFMLCNVQPRYNLPVVFQHDAWFIVFMILFAFSSGYLASLCMCFGPKLVAPHEAETAGAIMAFFLSLGLALGASFSFFFRAIV